MTYRDASRELVREVREALRAAACPENAGPMQAYMRSAMPFLGVKTPERRRLLKPVISAHSLASFSAWRDTTLALWRDAEYREERYAAIELVRARPYDRFQTMSALPLYEEMIVTGAWWDLVDGIAPYRLCDLLERQPSTMAKRLKAWARGCDIWKRRSAIIAQLGRKHDADLDLLYACIEPSIDRPEFFLRKAIGWALRQHAYTDPEEVVRYVRAHAGELSPLSKREAVRNLVKAGIIDAVP